MTVKKWNIWIWRMTSKLLQWYGFRNALSLWIWPQIHDVSRRNVSPNLTPNSKRLDDVPTPSKMVQEGWETCRWNRRENVSQDSASDPGRPSGGASTLLVHVGRWWFVAQAIDGNPVGVDPSGGAGSSHQVVLWTCPGRQDVLAGRRILAPSAADVLRKSVHVVGPGVVFLVLGHSPRGVRYKAVFHLVTNPYVLPGAVFHPRVKPSSPIKTVVKNDWLLAKIRRSN